MQRGKKTRSFMRKNPQEMLQEGLPEQARRGQNISVAHEPSSAAWIQKSIHTGKSSDRPTYANSNSSSR